MKIFPAIDIKDKKCVRLVKGDFDNKTEYEMSPFEQAGKFKKLLIILRPILSLFSGWNWVPKIFSFSTEATILDE